MSPAGRAGGHFFLPTPIPIQPPNRVSPPSPGSNSVRDRTHSSFLTYRPRYSDVVPAFPCTSAVAVNTSPSAFHVPVFTIDLPPVGDGIVALNVPSSPN